MTSQYGLEKPEIHKFSVRRIVKAYIDMLGPMSGATLDVSQKAEKSIGLPRLVKELSHGPQTILDQSQVQKSCVIFYGLNLSPKEFYNYCHNLSHGKL